MTCLQNTSHHQTLLYPGPPLLPTSALACLMSVDFDSIGLRSDDWFCHTKIFHLFILNNSLVAVAVTLGLLKTCLYILLISKSQCASFIGSHTSWSHTVTVSFNYILEVMSYALDDVPFFPPLFTLSIIVIVNDFFVWSVHRTFFEDPAGFFYVFLWIVTSFFKVTSGLHLDMNSLKFWSCRHKCYISGSNKKYCCIPYYFSTFALLTLL